jgi:hypothetical protein
MPYWFESKKIKMPRAHDRRVKLTEAERQEIRELHISGWPLRKIARKFKDQCSRRLIMFIIYPERLAAARAGYKERRKDGRYYIRTKHTAAIRKHRHHKQAVLLGLALPGQTNNGGKLNWRR